MSLHIVPSKLTLAKGVPYPFGGTGGTPPYTFSLLPGGVGGQIDADTGQYVAPSVTGFQKVQVSDSLGATSQVNVLVGDVLKLVCDLIETGMNLQRDQVFLWDQKVNIPNDSKLYIAVGLLSAKPFSNTSTLDPNGNEIQSVNMSGMVSIDISSRSTEALNRKEEILMALNSYYAEAQQELNSFRIFPLPQNFINLSEEEGAAILYRFNISVAIQYVVVKSKAIPYFNTFSDVEVTPES